MLACCCRVVHSFPGSGSLLGPHHRHVCQICCRSPCGHFFAGICGTPHHNCLFGHGCCSSATAVLSAECIAWQHAVSHGPIMANVSCVQSYCQGCCQTSVALHTIRQDAVHLGQLHDFHTAHCQVHALLVGQPVPGLLTIHITPYCQMLMINYCTVDDMPI